MSLLAIWAILGIVTGYSLGGRGSRVAGILMLATALALILEIGYSVGVGVGEGAVNIGTLLAKSLALALVTSVASIMVSLVILRETNRTGGLGDTANQKAGDRGGSAESPFISLLFTATLLFGAIIGYNRWSLPSLDINLLLYLLLASAGYSVGSLGTKLRHLWGEAGRAGMKLALATLSGGAFGGAVVWAASGWNASIGAAAGMASGWYSLAGPLLMNIDSMMGAVAFLGNLLRETIHIITYPVIARRLPLNAIVVGGATTMDTGLPPVMLKSGPETGLVAFIHGAVLTVFLGFFLPFYVGLLA